MSHDLIVADGETGLTSSAAGLFATPTAPLPYVKGGVVRSFLLEREQGNIIVYNSPGVTAVADEIKSMGKPDRLLLSHWHEEMYGVPGLDVPIHVNELDRAQAERSLPIAASFVGRQMIGDDLEIIPTPGHTPGTTTFLWDNGAHRFLFTGDWVTVEQGVWKAVLLGDSDRQDYLASIELLMELEFDFLVPWGNVAGQPYGFAVTRGEARAQLEQIAECFHAGQSR